MYTVILSGVCTLYLVYASGMCVYGCMRMCVCECVSSVCVCVCSVLVELCKIFCYKDEKTRKNFLRMFLSGATLCSVAVCLLVYSSRTVD